MAAASRQQNCRQALHRQCRRRAGKILVHLEPTILPLRRGPSAAAAAAAAASGAVHAQDLDLDAVQRDFSRNGFCIIRNIVEEDVRLAVQDELEALVQEAASATLGPSKACTHENEPFETRMLALFAEDLTKAPESWRRELHRPGLFPLFFHPTILDIVSYLIGSDEIRLYPNYTTRPKVPARYHQVRWHQVWSA